MKKDKKYYALYGYNEDELNPLSTRSMQYNPINVDQYQAKEATLPSTNQQQTQTNNIGTNVGMAGLRNIGNIISGFMTGAPQLINALLPDQPLEEEDRTLPRAINPYPMGTGSEALYRNGGEISPEKAREILKDGKIRGKKLTEKQRRFFGAMSNRDAQFGDYITTTRKAGKKGRIQVTEEIPETLPVDQDATVSTRNQYEIPQTIQQFQPQPVVLPEQSRRVEFERLLDTEGNVTGYSPIFSNNYSYWDALSTMRELPEQFDGIPVVKSPELYRDLWEGFMPASMSYDWTKSNPNFEDGGLIPYTAKSGIYIKPSKRGSLHTALGVPQDEKIPVSKLQINEGDSPALKKKKQFALNARKWSKKENGGMIDYEVGQELDLTLEQIRELQNRGYEIEF